MSPSDNGHLTHGRFLGFSGREPLPPLHTCSALCVFLEQPLPYLSGFVLVISVTKMLRSVSLELLRPWRLWGRVLASPWGSLQFSQVVQSEQDVVFPHIPWKRKHTFLSVN